MADLYTTYLEKDGERPSFPLKVVWRQFREEEVFEDECDLACNLEIFNSWTPDTREEALVFDASGRRIHLKLGLLGSDLVIGPFLDEEAEDLVGNSQALSSVMGGWPGFHDAEVKQVTSHGGDLSVVVHVFEMTEEVDPEGRFVLDKHHLVTFGLLGVVSSRLPKGYRGDTLAGIEFLPREGGITVWFDSIIDPSLTWHADCREARILEVAPYRK